MRDWPPRLIASARIASDGTLSRPIGITAATRNGVGDYSVTLDNEYDPAALHVTISARGGTPIAWSWVPVLPPSTDVVINIAQATDGAPVDADFSIRVYSDA